MTPPPPFPPQGPPVAHALPYTLFDEERTGSLVVLRRWIYTIGIVLAALTIVRQSAEIAKALPALHAEDFSTTREIEHIGEPAPELIVAFGGAILLCSAIVLIASVIGLCGVKSARLWVLWPAAVWGLVGLMSTLCQITAQQRGLSDSMTEAREHASQLAMYGLWICTELVYPLMCIAILSRRS